MVACGGANSAFRRSLLGREFTAVTLDPPGLALTDLSAQADLFDPAALTQDITILEELRRNARHSQAARALIDATLVRLTLADQFSNIGELIARLDGEPAPPRPARAPSAPAAASFAAQKKNDPPVATPPAPGFESVVTATASTAVVEDEDDDDLPRPGKVWENSGPSLSELLKAEAAKTATVAVTVEAVVTGDIDPDDLGQVWQRTVSELAEPLGPMVHSVIAKGRLSAIDDGQAVIHFNAEDSTLVKTLDRSGRKEALQRKISELMKKTVGVRFQFNGTSEAPAPAAEPTTSKPREPAPSRAPEPPPTPAVPTIKITPELIETLREEPLVKALMDQMAAQVVKVE